MSRTVRIEVHPDVDGGWTVTRDRIVDGHFAALDRAEVYARTCVERARAAGQVATLKIHEPMRESQPRQ